MQLRAKEQQESVKLSAEERAAMIELYEAKLREADQQAKAKQSAMDQALTAQLFQRRLRRQEQLEQRQQAAIAAAAASELFRREAEARHHTGSDRDTVTGSSSRSISKKGSTLRQPASVSKEHLAVDGHQPRITAAMTAGLGLEQVAVQDHASGRLSSPCDADGRLAGGDSEVEEGSGRSRWSLFNT